VTLDGVILPVTTPFEDDRVSPARLRDNIARYEQAGVAGYLLFGSTGEAALLDEPEKLELLRAARAAIPAGRRLIAGVGRESTAATIRLARTAADHGADLLLVLTPHYYGDRMDGEALESHYRRVADASPLPVLLYDVPKFTHVRIPAASVAALSRHERIVGIKDSAGDLERLVALVERSDDTFVVVCGSHAIAAQAFARGVPAAILAAADLFPDEYVEVHRLVRDGRDAAALELQQRLAPASGLAVATLGVPGIKAALDLRGFYGGPPRPPLLPLPAEDTARLRDAIRAAGARAPGASP